jgi:hypothetical protein
VTALAKKVMIVTSDLQPPPPPLPPPLPPPPFSLISHTYNKFTKKFLLYLKITFPHSIQKKPQLCNVSTHFLNPCVTEQRRVPNESSAQVFGRWGKKINFFKSIKKLLL